MVAASGSVAGVVRPPTNAHCVGRANGLRLALEDPANVGHGGVGKRNRYHLFVM